MIRVAVVGATGYAGAELVRLLSGHPHVTITVLTSRNYVGEAFDRIYPALSGVVNRKCEAFDIDAVSENADIVFTALPHKLPMEIVPGLIENGMKVIDLSADFRFRDPERYERHYQPHTAKDLLDRSVYGLSEIYTDDISHATLIGNPGCYPTSVLLPLVPLVKDGLLELQTLIADSKSGVSGAGRSPSLTTLYCAVAESFKAYKIAAHRHNPEMEEVLGHQAGREVALTFVPHLLPMSRGMETTIYATPAAGVDLEDVRASSGDVLCRTKVREAMCRRPTAGYAPCEGNELLRYRVGLRQAVQPNDFTFGYRQPGQRRCRPGGSEYEYHARNG